MKNLLAFWLPGALLVSPVLPLLRNARPEVTLLILASVPLLGAVVHQLARCYFEAWGGYWSKNRRTVIKFLATSYKLEKREADAFLLWETTFYSGKFPKEFCDHVHGAWQFIQSAWGVRIGAGMAAIACVIMTRTSLDRHAQLAIFDLVVLAIFWVKGRQTHRRLLSEELVMAARLASPLSGAAPSLDPFSASSDAITATDSLRQW